MAFLKEFKEFALKGNVMDMAVGVIIGGAFGKIVSSLVNDILMPPIGALIGNTDFSQLRLDISKVRDVTSNAMHSVGDMVTGGGDPAQAAAAAEPIYWNYGAFIQQCVDFTILALCVFLMVKLMNRLMKKKEEAPAPVPEPPAPTKEELLLTETDAPYMTPEPLRGATCGPEHVVFTAEKLCEVRGLAFGEERETFLRRLLANAYELLDREPTPWQRERAEELGIEELSPAERARAAVAQWRAGKA